MLDAARWAPSGGNLQPWKVVVVAGEEKQAVTSAALEALASNPEGQEGEHPIYPKPLPEPYRTRRFRVGEQMHTLLGNDRADKAARLQSVVRNFEFWGAPVGLFFVIDRDMGRGQWAHLGMFMQSVALLVTEQGLASCFQEAWAMVRETLQEALGLGEGELVYCGMSIGHADPRAPVNTLRSPREDVDSFATFLGFA